MSGITDLLIESADRLFGDLVTPELHAAVDHGVWPEPLWTAMEEAGLLTAALPEPHGSGADKSDAAAIVRRAGFHTAPGPLVETTLAGWVLAAADALSAAGRCIAALDLGHELSPSNPDETKLTSVTWPSHAGAILTWGQAAADEILLLVPRGSTSMDADIAGEPVGEALFSREDLETAQPIRLNKGIDRDTILGWGAILTSAQLSGTLDRVLDDSLAYARERVQFGRAIGKFQAVQQLLAEAAGEVAAANAVTSAAVQALDEPNRDRLILLAAAAKARTGEAAGRVATICHQVHGAIGYTREFALHRATRRLWRGRDRFGTERYWQARLGDAAEHAGGDGLWPLVSSL